VFAGVARYGRLLAIQVRASALLSLQYRVDFLLQAVMSLFWTGAALVPLVVLFQMREGVAGWAWSEALVVVAFFTMLKGILAGAIQPGLLGVTEHIRKGTLDFLLLKPADAQFLVSTAKFDLARVSDFLGGLAILAFALAKGGHAVTLGGAVTAAALLAGAVAILYSIWILVIALAFFVVKVDNLSYLFISIYDAARWPSSIFTGIFAFLFTFVIPLALMTTYPALAVLGKITPVQLAAALATAAGFLVVSRRVWRKAIRKYTSAGG
jgi:ABC-2 type transport system permease protein